jgi:hypothetical protein
MKRTIPVSTVCPNCGETEFTKVPAIAKTSLTMDRCCKQCNTQYTPPIPLWFEFVLWGVLMTIPAYILLTARNSGDVSGSMWFAVSLSVVPVMRLLGRATRATPLPLKMKK